MKLYREPGDPITRSDQNGLEQAMFCGWVPPSGMEGKTDKTDRKWLASDYNDMINFWLSKMPLEKEPQRYGD